MKKQQSSRNKKVLDKLITDFMGLLFSLNIAKDSVDQTYAEIGTPKNDN